VDGRCRRPGGRRREGEDHGQLKSKHGETIMTSILLAVLLLSVASVLAPSTVISVLFSIAACRKLENRWRESAPKNPQQALRVVVQTEEREAGRRFTDSVAIASFLVGAGLTIWLQTVGFGWQLLAYLGALPAVSIVGLALYSCRHRRLRKAFLEGWNTG